MAKTSVLGNIYQNKNHQFYIGDICDSHFLDVIFEYERPDIVLHGAAESHVDDSLKDTVKFIQNNVVGTQTLVNAAVKWGVEKFVHISCYDEQTKAVTKSGIKSYQELKEGDLVLSINPETKEIEEKEIEKIIVQDYSGDMYHFKSNRVDFLTTPNHRYIYEQNNKLHWTTSEEMSDVKGKSYLPKGSINRAYKKYINIPGLGKVDSNALFYVCGAFIGDGFTAYQEKIRENKSGYTRADFIKKCRDPKTGRIISSKNTDPNAPKFIVTHNYRIFFDVPENDKCRVKLEKALTKLKINFHAEKNKSGEHIYFSSEKWLKFFDTFGKYAENKFIPEWMFDYGYDNLFNLLMGIHDSDGHGYNIRGKGALTTCSLKLRDQYCYLATMLGFHARFNEQGHNPNASINGRIIHQNFKAWQIHFSNKLSPLFPKANIINYNGKIWCLKVKDNKNFLVIRNGISAFSGNTDESYGQLKSDSEPSWTEESPINPRNPYAASKAASELVVQAAGTSFGLNYNITRSSNNYGPRQTAEKLLPKTIKSILNNQKIPVYGQGLQIRDWTYVTDNCAGLMKVITDGKPNEIYNISANQECTNIEIIQKICNIMGRGHDLIDFIKDPRGNAHDFRYSIDASKLKKLGWAPEIKLPEGLEMCVNWYNNNQYYLK
jgi:dTDP-glucose 4,6-dehydratase